MPSGALPNLVDVTCDEGRVSFTALGYSPDAGSQDVTIATTFGGSPQLLTYTVALAAPRLTGPPGGRYAYPLGQGVRTTVPFTDLFEGVGEGCEACDSSAPTFFGARVEPASAGSATFSGTGLVFRPAPDFSGRATLTFRVRDRFGQESDPVPLELSVLPGESHAPLVVADSVEVDADQDAHGNVLGNDVLDPDGGYSATVLSCGEPANGTVVCDPDGGYVYSPDEGFSGVDQFAYHVSTAPGGYHAVGSVVVGIGTDPRAVLEVPTANEVTPAMSLPRPVSLRERARNAGVLPVLRDALEAIHSGSAP